MRTGVTQEGFVLLCLLQFVCQRHAPTLVPRRVVLLRGRNGHHIHVQQVDAACQLPGVILQRPSTVDQLNFNRL
jgi:hypothetical protein